MKGLKEKILFLFTILNIVSFISLRYIWSGIMNVVGGEGWILVVLSAILFITFTISLINTFFLRKLYLWIIALTLSVMISGLFIYMLLDTLDYTLYFIRNFAAIFFVFFTLYLIIYVVFYLLRKPMHAKLVVYVHTGFFILTMCLSIGQVLDVGFMYFVTKPVVYAVEDEYQIVFETSRYATAEVKVGTDIYYESASGAITSSSKMHKVIVPMSVLDAAKEYEVKSTSILYRGPYNGVKGRTIVHESTFKPVDETDGIKFHVGTDFHDKKRSRVKTMQYKWEELDFIVLAGDISSFLETRKNISFINDAAHTASRGEIAVIYNRGNHETKGIYRDELARAVGTKDDNYYFTVRLANVFLIVLDLAEDHNDDWWEYYGVANYQNYRAEQIAWLSEVKDDVNNEYMWDTFDYRYVISHQPLSIINEDKGSLFLENEKKALVNLLNDMNIDASFAGHLHNLMYLRDLPAAALTVLPEFIAKQLAEGTGATFPEFVTSKHALSQSGANSKTKEQYSSLRVEISTSAKLAYFVNSNYQIVSTIEPVSGTQHTLINF